MRRLLKREEGPPVDAEGYPFRFVHRETGHKSASNDYWSWKEAILDHRRGMNLPIPEDIMALAEDQLCGTLPPELCSYEVGDPPPISTRIGLASVVNWIKASVRKATSGLSYVPQEEAERRAEICVACPYNVIIEGGCGGGCRDVTQWLTPGMAGKKTKQDTRLKSCAVCTCFNSIQVHFPLEILNADDTAERLAAYPEFCWKSPSEKNGN